MSNFAVGCIAEIESLDIKAFSKVPILPKWY
jgi:hypothetical protein